MPNDEDAQKLALQQEIDSLRSQIADKQHEIEETKANVVAVQTYN